MDNLVNELMVILNAPMLKEPISEEDLVKKLAVIVERWIEKDFNQFVEILYRVDINEKVLKDKLNNAAIGETGEIIAKLLLERQKQKLVLRNQFHFSKENIPEDERW
ncbi:hypothetical protein [Arachidicoccus soli]|uniref:Uncharacterized protein n=1 Tax=Arachidicoccus soli TaxID=2341117 RepID=A0A386HK95_9BACT|nr:hypothetical protein [Arachidicoccus soli]AYD46298.1 hypothetical protein D6B99_00875 [Arachidicoccus soli]